MQSGWPIQWQPLHDAECLTPAPRAAMEQEYSPGRSQRVPCQWDSLAPVAFSRLSPWDSTGDTGSEGAALCLQQCSLCMACAPLQCSAGRSCAACLCVRGWAAWQSWHLCDGNPVCFSSLFPLACPEGRERCSSCQSPGVKLCPLPTPLLQGLGHAPREASPVVPSPFPSMLGSWQESSRASRCCWLVTVQHLVTMQCYDSSGTQLQGWNTPGSHILRCRAPHGPQLGTRKDPHPAAPKSP